MKFKESTELRTLANEAGLSIIEFSNTVISALIKAEVIENDSYCWGHTVAESIDGDILVKTLVDILYNVGMPIVTNRIFNAFLKLVLMGDDDCPKCGGEMEVIDGKYKRIYGDGYMTPYEYEPEWEDKTCRHCGFVQIGDDITK